MSGAFGSSQWMYASGAEAGFYTKTINQSLRFEESDTPSLSRTQTSGTTTTWTFSAWVKRSRLDSVLQSGGVAGQDPIFCVGDANTDDMLIYFHQHSTADRLDIIIRDSSTIRAQLTTTRLFRDVAAFYHIQVTCDFTNATQGDRLRLYVNGVRETAFDTETYPSDASQITVVNNSSYTARIGQLRTTASYFAGYMAEVHLVDGSALEPTSFGEFSNGAWIPVNYSGGHGTAGWYLPFDDGAALGDDESANTNDFSTVVGLAASDVVPTSPTNTFATLNVLQAVGNATFSEGNLRLAGSGSDYDRAFSTIGLTSGKWYAEFRYISGDNRGFFGVIREDSYTQVAGDYIGELANQYGLDFMARSYSNNVELFDTTDFSIGDIGLLCFDIDNGKIYFGRRDISGATTIWYDSAGANNGDPSAGTNPTYTGTFTGHTWFIGCSDFNTTTVHANFGADGSFSGGITSGGLSDANGNGDFNYIEDGFLAMCSANLPEPAIGPNSGVGEQADNYFNTVLYTGTGAAQSITLANLAPDLLWIKRRNAVNSHVLYDSVRGDWELSSNSTGRDVSSAGRIGSLDADGFTLENTTAGTLNASGGSYVSWLWKAGGTAVSNTSGSITSSVSANPDAGFSIVGYTGTGANATVGHGLSSAPEMVIVKNRDDGTKQWIVYHKGVASDPETDYLLLNDTDAKADSNAFWNDTAPTSSVFSIGTGNAVNASGDNFIAYCFHSVEGYSKVGSYVGNANANGTFIYTGFRPAWIMMKGANTTGDWFILDATRSAFNEADDRLDADNSNAESTSNSDIDFLSNGIKIRTASTTGINQLNDTHIYLAFAEAPFKYANAR